MDFSTLDTNLPLNGMYITTSCSTGSVVLGIPLHSTADQQQHQSNGNTNNSQLESHPVASDVFMCGLCQYRTNNMDLFFLHKQQPHYPVITLPSVVEAPNHFVSTDASTSASTGMQVYVHQHSTQSTSVVRPPPDHTLVESGELLTVLEACPSHSNDDAKYVFSMLDESLDLGPPPPLNAGANNGYLLPVSSGLEQHSYNTSMGPEMHLFTHETEPSSYISSMNLVQQVSAGGPEDLNLNFPPFHNNHSLYLGMSETHGDFCNSLPLPPISQIKVRSGPLLLDHNDGKTNRPLLCGYDGPVAGTTSNSSLLHFHSQQQPQQIASASHLLSAIACSSSTTAAGEFKIPLQNHNTFHGSLRNLMVTNGSNVREVSTYLTDGEAQTSHDLLTSAMLPASSASSSLPDSVTETSVLTTTPPISPLSECVACPVIHFPPPAPTLPQSPPALHAQPISPRRPSSSTVKSKTASSYQCKKCSQRFSQQAHFRVHQRSHRKDTTGTTTASNPTVKSFMCILCGKMFSRQANVKVHLASHKVWPTPKLQTRRFVKNIISEEKYTNLNSRSSKPGPAPSNQSRCGRRDWTSLCRRTIDSHYRCLLCDQVLLTYGHLRCHATEHEHQLVYPCPRAAGGCRMTFATVDEVSRHIEEHRVNGENVYVCPTCTVWETLDAEQFRDHTLQHRQRPNKPASSHKKTSQEICTEAPVEEVRERKKRTGRTFTCHWCSAMYQSETQFVLHQLTVHRRKANVSSLLLTQLAQTKCATGNKKSAATGQTVTLQCPVCPRQFVRRTLYEQHVTMCRQNVATKEWKEQLRAHKKSRSSVKSGVEVEHSPLEQSTASGNILEATQSPDLIPQDGDQLQRRRSTRQRAFTSHWTKPRASRPRRESRKTTNTLGDSYETCGMETGDTTRMGNTLNVDEYIPIASSYHLAPTYTTNTSAALQQDTLSNTKTSFLESLRNDSFECDSF